MEIALELHMIFRNIYLQRFNNHVVNSQGNRNIRWTELVPYSWHYVDLCIIFMCVSVYSYHYLTHWSQVCAVAILI